MSFVDSGGRDLFLEKQNFKPSTIRKEIPHLKTKEKQDQENTIQEISFISKSILLQFARQCVDDDNDEGKNYYY